MNICKPELLDFCPWITTRLGQLIASFVSEDEGLFIVERSLDLYRLYGAPKERFGDTIQRIGFDAYVREILGSQ